MATALESPGLFPDSPFEQEDMIYPCKACGDILEEGKAYELAGNRWHIDCFRCNTCGTLLDSDANLLLLGDGSLICNNCTYSCNACGNKIEDLAILTGDQAFCSGCFRCRNCKRKIENLRYARTSQGIFCMSCHESLMARRRKKSKASTKSGQNGVSTTKEKALPSLPSTMGTQAALSPDTDSPSMETPDSTGAVSPAPERQNRSTKLARSTESSKDSSTKGEEPRTGMCARLRKPIRSTVVHELTDAATLPASTYDDARFAQRSQEPEDNEKEGFLPMAFDPNPAPGPPPMARKQVPPSQDAPPSVSSDGRLSRESFNRIPPKSAYRDKLREEARPASPRSDSIDKERDRTISNGAHILYQEKGRSNKREPSTTDIPLVSDAAFSSTLNSVERDQGQSTRQPDAPALSRPDDLKNGETSLIRRAGSRTSSKADNMSPASPTERTGRERKTSSASPSTQESPRISVNPFDDPRRRADPAIALSKQAERPVRGDSLTSGARRHVPTPEPPTPTLGGTTSFLQTQERKSSIASLPFMDVPTTLSRDTSRSKVTESPRAPGSFDSPPPRSSSRPGATAKSGTSDEAAALRMQPRTSPYGVAGQHRPAGSVSSLDGIGRSPALLHDSLDGAFSMEEEMIRIMRGETKKDDSTSSTLRKVSNAVKHSRSHSDRGLSSAGRASANDALETTTPVSISSPILSTFSGNEGPESLMAQLRRAHQRIAELEAANSALQEKVNSSNEIKAATNELREKRTTIVVLDTQREMVVRELEAMKEHLTKAKESNQPLDLNALKGEVVKDFAASLQELKDQMSLQIEELMHRRNELTDEISNLIQMKDKGFQEYESLSTKNAQLLEMNNQILQNIQEMYKSNRTNNGAANGLGIYNPISKSETSGQSELRNLNLVSTDSSMPNLLQETEADSATVLNAPQVVNIRKAQPKRFNWRRGGEKVAKGIKGAFTKEEYGQPLGAAGNDQYVLGGRQGSDAGRGAAGFGLFGQKGGTLRPGIDQLKSSGSSTNLVADASVLFGSELDIRCEYEKRVVPSIVTRCIDEVEARGMDMEGIYRKSGGSGQVKQVQQGFEKDGGYDISDPDLDIHAVTSALKQYLRKLPTPLITYEVYDILLDAGRLTDLEKQSVALRLAVGELPEPHRNCLEYLFQHLARIVSHQSENLMTPLNLAVVFAPTIMRPLSIEREMSDMQAQRVAVQALLEQHDAVFAEEE